MRNRKSSEKDPKIVKKSLVASLCMLLISAILLVGTSFAWLTLSIAPEVMGVSTNIAANGSLEMALLTTSTRQDLSTIQTGIGNTLLNNKTTANHTWGNLVNLVDESYGLGEITLMPTRLDLVMNNDGTYTVGSGMLQVPTYAEDGRIIELSRDTISAIYGADGFSTILGKQDYGVRAIGTSDTLSVQASALALAKSNIVTYTNSARNTAREALSDNINELFGIISNYKLDSNYDYSDTDIDVLLYLTEDLETSLDYIELALRQGMIAHLASMVSDEDQFNTLRDMITQGMPLEQISSMAGGMLPSGFTTWVAALSESQNKVNDAYNSCVAMKENGAPYTWEQMKEIMTPLINMDKVYIGETLFGNLSGSELSGYMGKSVTMTLVSGSGIFADVADFTGNYSIVANVMTMDLTVSVESNEDPAYLEALSDDVQTLQPAEGNSSEMEVVLQNTYGYALDLAFRTNADMSDLLLQTNATQRIYEDSTSESTLGGGSYMEFTTSDDTYTFDQMVRLIDAVRVGFLDDQGKVLGIAKLNTSNRTTENGVMHAPLYLYEFSLSQEPENYGALVMGERSTVDNVLTPLTQNVAKAMTVVVWLDGDLVDNTMVSAGAKDGHTLNGILNLQFASSADLVPARDNSLLGITSDKDGLTQLVDVHKTIIEAGNADNKYTTVSWTNYVEAYEFAKTVAENPSANSMVIYNASQKLVAAKAELVTVDVSSIQQKVAQYRAKVGTLETDIARYVIIENGEYIALSAPTQEQIDASVGIIPRVDYSYNLNDEGNGVMVPIYTESSWENYAAALYAAEMILMKPNPSDVELDDAITLLDTVDKALQHRIMYEPYEYGDSIYYFAITSPEDQDTYGKWYYSDFKRVVSDLTILRLDTNAKKVAIAEIVQDEYVKYNDSNQIITPTVELLKEKYPDLNKDEVAAVYWSVDQHFVMVKTSRQHSTLQDLIAEAGELSGQYSVDSELLSKAEDYLGISASYSEVQDIIEKLAADIYAKKLQKQKDEAEASTVMTANQRQVLTLAVNNARASQYWMETVEESNPDKEKIEALKSAVEDVEAFLQSDSPTLIEADDKLTAINAAMTALGLKEVTIANSIKLTLGLDYYDVDYTQDMSSAFLVPNSQTGEGTVKAVVYTENGVLLTLTKKITCYVAAEDAWIVDPESTADPVEEVSSITLETIGDAMDIKAILKFNDAELNDSDLNLSIFENIKSCTWSSGDTKIVSVSNTDVDGCLVTAKGNGTTVIQLTVETNTGNKYTASVTVTVDDSAS